MDYILLCCFIFLFRISVIYSEEICNDKRCFNFINERMSRDDASQYCKQNGSHLVFIDSREEQNLVNSLSRGQPFWTGGWIQSIGWHWDSDINLKLGRQGCYWNYESQPDLDYKTNLNVESADECIDHCRNMEYAYAGIHGMDECYCGNSFGKHGIANGFFCQKCRDGKSICGSRSSRDPSMMYIYAVDGGYAGWFSTGPGKDPIHRTCAVTVKRPVPYLRDPDFRFLWMTEKCNFRTGYICEYKTDSSSCEYMLGDRCLKLSRGKVNWFTARQKCFELNGNLLRVHSSDEQNELRRLLLSSNGTAGDKFWMGATFNTWRWGDKNGGNEWRYTNFPRETLSSVGNLENCVLSHRTWRNSDCDRKLKFICERDIVVVGAFGLHWDEFTYVRVIGVVLSGFLIIVVLGIGVVLLCRSCKGPATPPDDDMLLEAK